MLCESPLEEASKLSAATVTLSSSSFKKLLARSTARSVHIYGSRKTIT